MWKIADTIIIFLLIHSEKPFKIICLKLSVSLISIDSGCLPLRENHADELMVIARNAF